MSWPSESLSLLSFSIALFLVLILLFDGERRPQTNLLIVLLAAFTAWFLFRFGLASESPWVPYLPLIAFPLGFAVGPALFLYARTVLRQTGLPFWGLAMLVVPPVLAMLFVAFCLIAYPEFRDAAAVRAQSGRIAVATPPLFLTRTVWTVICFAATLRELRGFALAEAGEIERDQYHWIRGFLRLNAGILVAVLLVNVLIRSGTLSIQLSPLEGAIALGLMYFVLYYRIRRPHIFLHGTPARTVDGSPKYARQNLEPDQRKDLLRLIQDYMDAEEPYLDEDFKLNDLAERTDIPAHHVTMVLNLELGMNFFRFLNSYRVARATSFLRDPDFRSETILNIAFRSGFQTKAAFNKVFKQETGSTPRLYREQALSGS